MKCYVGVDLGSTTSKAVILDDKGEILGRGITNSRSNYEMASSVARTEAYVNAKFTLFRRGLAARGGAGGVAEALEQSFRLVVEGPPNWTSFREFWKMFTDEGAVCVASTYTKVGGLYDRGFRHDPKDPLGTLADYCMGCYTNHSLPNRVDLISKYIEEYSADGFLINSVKSCASFSAGQLMILREVEKRTGRTGAFIESDLVDPRYFSAANIKNRIESYLQMLEQKRSAVAGAAR